MSDRSILIFGLGYSAAAFARLVAGEAAVTGTVRTAEKAAALAKSA